MSRKTTRGVKKSTPRRKWGWGMIFGGVAVLSVCVAIRYIWSVETVEAAQRTPPPKTAAPRQPTAPTTQPKLKIMAVVNGEQISRQALASECIKHYGKIVLVRVINKYLIMQECRRRNLNVSREEINAEIERMAKRFSLPVDQWMKLLQEERGISPEQYASDILWPTLALRKLSKSQLAVTPEEIQEEFETQYGPSVKVRLIVCDSSTKAAAVRAKVIANPAEFAKVAQAESVDASSASVGGLIAPVRRHIGLKEVEQAAFQMKPGEISQVIPVSKQYAILMCEAHLPGRRIALEQVKLRLIETLRERKLSKVATETFRKIKEGSSIVNLLEDPSKRNTMPGIVAVINGQKIAEFELAELCIERHGKEVLEGTINRLLLVQACKRQGISVTRADIDEEIRRAASLMIELKPDGSPNIERWIEIMTTEQGVSEELYRSDSVWPSIALKKLVGKKVVITDEDLKRGFDANYGPRIRCLAIVLNDLRRAQKAWDLARKDPSNENFGKLASEYSIDAASSSIGGEIPPIHIHGSQPKLEEIAFALKPGELSSIIHTGPEVYVILKCLGRTTPTDITFEEVRDLIHGEVFEKKQQVAMGEYFQKLQDSARIENYLARTSHSPARSRSIPTNR